MWTIESQNTIARFGTEDEAKDFQRMLNARGEIGSSRERED